MAKAPLNILLVHASGRKEGSVTRQLAEEGLAAIKTAGQPVTVTRRDLADGVPLVDQDWIAANFTPVGQRTAQQTAMLSYSNALVDELKRADLIVIGAPVYNFGIPAALKAWIDQITRAGLTFRYTQDGPVGLLENKKTLIVAASGGTALGSELDFATPYLRHLLGFIGVKDVSAVGADALMADRDAALAGARDALSAYAASIAASHTAQDAA